MRSGHVRLGAVFILVTLTLNAATIEGLVKSIIVDKQTRVFLISLTEPPLDTITYTNQNLSDGSFSFPDVRPGRYVLYACAVDQHGRPESSWDRSPVVDIASEASRQYVVLRPGKSLSQPVFIQGQLRINEPNLNVRIFTPCGAPKIEVRQNGYCVHGARLGERDRLAVVAVFSGGRLLKADPNVHLTPTPLPVNLKIQGDTIVAVREVRAPGRNLGRGGSAGAGARLSMSFAPAAFTETGAPPAVSALPTAGLQIPEDAALAGGVVEGANDSDLFSEPAVATALAGSAWHGRIQAGVQPGGSAGHAYFQLPGQTRWQQTLTEAQVGGPLLKDRWFLLGHVEAGYARESPGFAPMLVDRLERVNVIRRSLLGLEAEKLDAYTPSLRRVSPYVRSDWKSGSHSLAMLVSTVRDGFDEQFFPAQAQTPSLPSTAFEGTSRHWTGSARYHVVAGATANELSAAFRNDRVRFDPLRPDETSWLFQGIAAMGRSNSMAFGNGYESSNPSLTDTLLMNRGRWTLRASAGWSRQSHMLTYAPFDAGRVVSEPEVLRTNRQTPELVERGPALDPAEFSNSMVRTSGSVTVRAAAGLTIDVGTSVETWLLPGRKRIALEPNIGFAWDVGARSATQVRASWSRNVAPFPMMPFGYEELLGPSAAQSPVNSYSREGGLSGLALLELIQQVTIPGDVPPLPYRRLAVQYSRRADFPYIHQATVQVSRRVLGSAVIEAGFHNMWVRRLLASTNINVLPTADQTAGGDADFGFRRALIDFTQLFEYQTAGRGTYRIVEAAFRRSALRGLTLNAHYWFTRNIDDTPAGSFEYTPENPLDRRKERATSDLNIGQRCELLMNIEAAELASGLQASGVLRGFWIDTALAVQSGRWYNVLAGMDANRDANPLTDRPGVLGRNTFRGSGLVQLDTRVGWRKRWREGTRSVGASVAAYNLLNRANFTGFSTVLGRESLAGVDTRVLTGAAGVSGHHFGSPLMAGGFGQAIRTAIPRRIEFGFRVEF